MSSPVQRRGIVALVGLIIAAMVALVSFSVPLYRLFCAVTGAGGTTQRVARNTTQRTGKIVTVFFNTDVSAALPWSFRPVQRSVSLHLGEQVPAYFEATNNSDQSVIGHATFNVTPDKAGRYFKKVQCFCFNEERLAPHQTVQMPVQFFVDPEIARDPATADVDQITLSYTFFRSTRPAGALDLARLATAAPDAARGAALFATQCGACHALDRIKVGPPLGGVIGRVAGAVAGYHYSAPLARSGIVWTPETVTRWLLDPQTDVPGTLMPTPISDAATRRDIVRYLQSLPPPAPKT